ncbi:MAG TPA: hypothetical protein VJ770_11830 [Stellaceae bacterium]|nr:hypothetical protein [Stellaceae bacterium]
MPLTMDHARMWRARAEEIRAKAENYMSPEAKRGMLNAAHVYELLADELEKELTKRPEGSSNVIEN